MRFEMGRLVDRPPVSVEEVAELCGIKAPTWSTWENGAMPRNMGHVVRKISDATGYDSEWLMWGGALEPSTSGYISDDAGGPPDLTLVNGTSKAKQTGFTQSPLVASIP